MKINSFNKTRQMLSETMVENDSFFKLFSELDDNIYSKGAIPKKYKELTGLAISVLNRCDECVLYHIQGCIKVNASKQEIIEAIKMGVIGGGSLTYPTARFAFSTMKELKILK